MSFSRLSRQSAKRLAEIEEDSNRPPWSKKLFEGEFQLPHSYVYGVRREGFLIGFLIVHVIESDAHIVNFAIDKEHRGIGGGKSLLRYVLSELRDNGVSSVTLEVRIGNAVSIGLYQKFGFDTVGKRKGYYSDDGEDALLMKVVL